jgi:hypothetical protein
VGRRKSLMTDQTPKPKQRTSKPQRPPFVKGDLTALVHGADSPTVIAEKAKVIHERILETFPELDSPRLIGSVNRYCEAEARLQLATAGLIQQAATEKGIAPRLLESASSATRLAQELADQLGLSIKGHAELRQTAAYTLREEERLAGVVANAIHGVLSDLGVAQDERTAEVVRRHLAALDHAEEETDDAVLATSVELVPVERGGRAGS